MRVLLVEDSPILRESIREMLSSNKHIEIEDFAETQDEAISLLEKKQFDLMIVDIELAEGNGFNVVNHSQLATYKYKPPIALMLTNHGNSYYRVLAKNAGAKYFFDKSMQFEDAIQTIEDESAKLASAKE
jgi:DNA-binding NarL/FixJ family response regulator